MTDRDGIIKYNRKGGTMEENNKIRFDNGITLEQNALTYSIERWAKSHWNIDGLAVYYDAVDHNYLFAQNKVPVFYSHGTYEAACHKLDMWALAVQADKKQLESYKEALHDQ
jgi:hypothetical protein